jgi:hypothetical protein
VKTLQSKRAPRPPTLQVGHADFSSFRIAVAAVEAAVHAHRNRSFRQESAMSMHASIVAVVLMFAAGCRNIVRQ